MSATWSFHPYRLPLARPYAWARGTQRERRGVLVACTLDGAGPASATGWGEMAPPPDLEADPAAIAATARTRHREALRASDVPAALDADGCSPRVRAGLAGAWLDAHARKAGQPLSAFVAERLGLGREPASSVPVNALVPAVPAAEAAALATEAVRQGFTSVKVKCTGDTDADLARLQAVRAALGPERSLRVDANGSWDPQEALGILRRLEGLRPDYVEQPVPPGDRDALVRLLRESPVRIALDESAASWPDIASLAAFHPIVIAKPQRLGGIDRAVHLAERATRAGMPVVVTNSLETAVGRAHALHAAALLPVPIPACGLATAGFFARDVGDGPPPAHGRMVVPALPGIGFDPRVEGWHAPPLA